MRDKRTKLLTFVITWMDGGAFKPSQILAKMEVNSGGRGRKQRRGKGKNTELGLDEGFI